MILTKTALISSLITTSVSSVAPNANTPTSFVTNSSYSPLIGEINVSYWQYCFGPLANDDWWSEKVTVLPYWTDYGPTWTDFITHYNYFAFNHNSLLCIKSPYQTTTTNDLMVETSQILDHPNFTFLFSQHKRNTIVGPLLMLDTGFVLWHDQQNIYWECFLSEFSLFSLNTSEIDLYYESFSFEHHN